jgi:hypothetical protein
VEAPSTSSTYNVLKRLHINISLRIFKYFRNLLSTEQTGIRRRNVNLTAIGLCDFAA